MHRWLALIVSIAACGASEPAPTAVRVIPAADAARSIDAPVVPDAPPDARPVASPISCKTVNDCWIEGITPIARPARLRGRKFAPCHDGEAAPTCVRGQCGAGPVYPC